MGRLNIIWVCPQGERIAIKGNLKLCLLQTFSCFIYTSSDNTTIEGFFTNFQNIFLFHSFILLKDFFSLFLHLGRLLVSNPGALKEALGMESALHSLPELRMTPDRSKNFIRTDSSICLSKALLNVYVYMCMC